MIDPPSDAAVVGLAVMTALGAWWRPEPPGFLVASAVVVALAIRRPITIGVVLMLAASILSGRSWAGLEPPDRARFEGTVTLISDPAETAFGLRADVRAAGRRLELRASDGAAGVLSRALAGERLVVSGRIGPPPQDAPWLVPRHISGRLVAEHVELHDRGAVHHRAANRLRRLLEDGSSAMPRTVRSLYGGFVLGDDRGQPPEVTDDFLGSGLTHVLVVSGSNVAFVLVLVSPLTGRLGLVSRWLVTLCVIGSFALLTRFEPSVLRASAMAAVAVTGGMLGRPQTGLRTLAVAVIGLLLIDPLLVHSTAFQLSAAASAGILLLGPWIRRHLPGPTLLRDTLGVTIAAQIGVVPVLLPRFGGMPVVALPANVLAVPVAGAVTTWGLPAGIVAGAFGGRVADLVHLPTRAMIAWVAGVARVGSSLPLGEIGPIEVGVAVLAGGAALALRADGRSGGARVPILWGLVAVALLAPAVALRDPPGMVHLGDDTVLHRAGGGAVLVVGASPYPDDVIEGLRREGVRRIDLIVWQGEPDRRLRSAIAARTSIGGAVGPDDRPVDLRVGGVRVRAGGGRPPDVGSGPVVGNIDAGRADRPR